MDDNGGNYANFFSASATSGIVRVRTRDACGWSAPTFLSLNFSNCSNGGGLRYSTHPNPANHTLYIDKSLESQQPAGAANFALKGSASTNYDTTATSTATLYDLMGIEVRSQTPAEGSMNISGLVTGHYILVIEGEGESEAHHIIVE